MKTLQLFVFATAIVSFMATSALAYQFSPPNIDATLKGVLTFNPNEGQHTQPFTCKTAIRIRTFSGDAKVKVIILPDGDCEGLNFQSFPWEIVITGSNTGYIGPVNYSSSDGNCNCQVQYQVNSNGIWSFADGQGMSGKLKSNPPVTIVP